jgi:benzoylformate decarboxylase
MQTASNANESRLVASPISELDKAGRRRGAALLLEVLRSEGVRYVFGNPGTTELPFIDALVDFPDIRYIWALQEASVVAMADGYAQASRRTGFVNLHTAGGLGHGFGSLWNASVSGTPLVVTAGQQDSRHAVTDPLLFGDLVGMATPIVKWAKEVTHVAQIPVLIRRAFHDSNTPPTGPVFVSLPMDIMEEMTDTSALEVSTIDRSSVAGSLDSLAEQLAAIAPGKLAIVAGDEISATCASSEMVELAEALGAPVYGSSWPAHLPFPTSHPQWAGNLPTRANEIAKILSNYDAVFGLGGKSLITILYTEGSAVPPGCLVFQMSADARNLGRTYPAKLAVAGDIKASLKALLPLLTERLATRAGAYAELREAARIAQARRRAHLEAAAEADAGAPVTTPLLAAREIARAVGSQIAIIDEAPATAAHLRSFLNSSSPRQYSFSRGGALGWGMPAAVGFSLGLDRGPVVAIVGDGAALYSPQAIWTAAYEKLPVTFVVINNRQYNVLKNFMRSQAGYASARANRFIAMDLADPPIDFLALAKSMGVPAQRLNTVADIAPAIEAAIASGEPSILEVPIA